MTNSEETCADCLPADNLWHTEPRGTWLLFCVGRAVAGQGFRVLPSSHSLREFCSASRVVSTRPAEVSEQALAPPGNLHAAAERVNSQGSWKCAASGCESEVGEQGWKEPCHGRCGGSSLATSVLPVCLIAK